VPNLKQGPSVKKFNTKWHDQKFIYISQEVGIEFVQVLNLLTVKNFAFLELNMDRMVKKTDQKIAEIIIQKGKNMLMKGLRL